MEFLKSSELELNPAKYLVGKSGKPVTHADFVEQQKKAEYVVKLATALQGKTFKAGKLDDLNAIKAQVKKEIEAGNSVKYVAEPTKPVSAVNEEMVKFALDFANYETEKEKVEKINEFMSEFSAINDVETVGEYFSEGLVKLNKLYTISEILEAVKANLEHLK